MSIMKSYLALAFLNLQSTAVLTTSTVKSRFATTTVQPKSGPYNQGTSFLPVNTSLNPPNSHLNHYHVNDHVLPITISPSLQAEMDRMEERLQELRQGLEREEFLQEDMDKRLRKLNNMKHSDVHCNNCIGHAVPCYCNCWFCDALDCVCMVLGPPLGIFLVIYIVFSILTCICKTCTEDPNDPSID